MEWRLNLAAEEMSRRLRTVVVAMAFPEGNVAFATVVNGRRWLLCEPRPAEEALTWVRGFLRAFLVQEMLGTVAA